MPRTNARTKTSKIPKSVRRSARAQYNGKATSVPNVPGALRARPLPKPNDSRCAGWLSKNRQPGLTSNSPEMVITASLDVKWITRCIVHDTAMPRNNFTDAGQRQVEPCPDTPPFRMARNGSSEAQLVIVAAGQDALPCQRRRQMAMQDRGCRQRRKIEPRAQLRGFQYMP